MKKVLLLGYFGQSNYGDELMLRAMLIKLTSLHVEVWIGKTGDQIGVESEFENVTKTCKWAGFGRSVYQIIKYLYCIFSADKVIFSGGTIFFDNVPKGHKNLNGILRTVLLRSFVGKRCSYYGVGVGELGTEKGRHKVAKILSKAGEICVRDSESFKKVELMSSEYGLKFRLAQGADPIYLMPEILLSNKQGEYGKVVAFCGMSIAIRNNIVVSEYVIKKTIAGVLNDYIDRGYKIVMLPMQIGQRDDREANKEICALINDVGSVELVDSILPLEQQNKIFEYSEVIVTMRYHPALVGLVLNKEVVAACVTEKLLLWSKSVSGWVSYYDFTGSKLGVNEKNLPSGGCNNYIDGQMELSRKGFDKVMFGDG